MDETIEKCMRGHEMIEENTYVSPTGRIHCRTCKRMVQREWQRNSRKLDKTKKKNKERSAKYRLSIKIEVMTYYCPNGIIKCACCGHTRIRHLTMDHIEGRENKNRHETGENSIYFYLKRENYPDGFQVLCSNCNGEKGSYGRCGCQDEAD